MMNRTRYTKTSILPRTLAVIVSCLLTLALVACGGPTATTAAPQTPPPAAETTAKPAETTAPAAESKAPETTAPQKTDPPAAEKPVELMVSAAASLTDVINELKEAFSKEHSHITVTSNYDSSGTLQQQISEGAPVDLFISAGIKQMNTLSEQKRVDEATRINLLANDVVLIVPHDSKLELKAFEDVLKDEVKMIAVGEASVPVGQYTEAIFTTLGKWDDVKAKANFGKDVRTVLAWVENGEVDCGVVYKTDAAITDKVKVVATAPEGSHKPVIYPAAVIAECKNPKEAKLFLDFLQTPASKAVFQKYGFNTEPKS